ncbi:metal-dependent hydrolase family protein [Rubinisphaera italica]|uniref:N-ethylammeline chlorohydrolase n=1 Tax=Rubinisphaera italica TaxID=2527969 RepID=A0A5C5XGB5_9PLAN|nr:amidohydrolase family protein [Rubinisphaera italica]TWT60892.1 N-ethylammeline chlorohydrolase [Rubinisphaera italica]
MDQYIAIENVRIFDGKKHSLQQGSVLVKDNLIEEVTQGKLEKPEGTISIDGGGRILSPGFIATHEHIILAGGLSDQDQPHWGYQGAWAAAFAKKWIDWGFTTIRSAGGADYGTKRAIDEGIIPGPRIYPSGAFLSVTCGHGDWRRYNTLHPKFGGARTPAEILGHTIIADGDADLMAASRENFRYGATQLKVMANGGVSSEYDPLDTFGFTEEELIAVVKVAENFNSYVMAHTYRSDTTQRALRCGIKSIEHGMLCDEETVQMMASEGAYLSTQAAAATILFAEENIPPFFNPDQKRKARMVRDGFGNLVNYAKAHNVKCSFSTDLCLSASAINLIPLEWTARQDYWTPFEILEQATSISADLCELCGPRNPYGKLGVVQKGALADLVVIDGNAHEDITLLSKPHESLKLIMKDGDLHKNELGSSAAPVPKMEKTSARDLLEGLSDEQVHILVEIARRSQQQTV